MKYQKKGKLLMTGIATALTVSLASAFFGAPSTEQSSTSLARQLAPVSNSFSFGDERAVITTAMQTAETSTKAETPAALNKEADGEVIVSSDRATESTSMVRVRNGGDLFPQGRAMAPAEKASAFLERHGSVFGIADSANELRIIGMKEDQYGNSRVTYQQMHGDVPVFGGVMHSHISQDGRLTAVNGKFVADVNLPSAPSINPDFAAQSAISSVSNQLPSMMKGADLTVASTSVLVYRENLTKGATGANHLAYQVEVTSGNSVREFVYVDAISGKIIDQVTGIHGVKKRRTHEGSIDVEPLWQEGDLRPALQPAHEDEVAGAGESYNLFFNLSGGTYRSWDGNDAEMITVNNDPTIQCPNAQWNGRSTNYCTGTSADDVVAHEWGHAYTQETSGLIYAYQSGALNESYSDIFGETVDQLNNREGIEGASALGSDDKRSENESDCSLHMSNDGTDNSIRWLMGEDAFAFTALPPVGDASIRDMWNPQCTGGDVFVPDPGHVTSENYHCAESDGGGVHVNSAINNRAYAMLVDGNTLEFRDGGEPFKSPVTVGAIGITKAAHIFWRANSMYNTPASNFNDNADSLEMACEDLIGLNLTKLVTSSEEMAPGFGGRDTVDPTLELSGEVITANDCAQVTNAIAAVEMRMDVSEMCGFKKMLDPAPAPMCDGGEMTPFYSIDWENGVGEWTTGQQGVTKATLDTAEWFLRSNELPGNRTGNVMYQENRRDLGNCASDDESGRLWMDSPVITVAGDQAHMMFEHFVQTEVSYDGGNVLISINGGAFTVVPNDAFVHNGYNGALSTAADQNTNPKEGQEAWHGANQGEVISSWGESQIDFAALGVTAGDQVQLRFELGQDGCNGNDGWYVDRIEMFTCTTPPPTEQCNVYPANSSDFLPVIGSPIVSLAAPSITTATVSGEEPVSSVSIRNLSGTHTYMGDLTFELQSPMGNSITLFDGGACAGEDWTAALALSDDATAPIGCNDWAAGGEVQPQEALTAFDAQDPNGDWSLTVSDAFPQDEGQVHGWALELCTPITGDNFPPIAGDDSATTTKNKPVTISVLANDSDPEGDSLTVDSVTQPTNGMTTLNADGTVTYQPNHNYIGNDTFYYTIGDGNGNTATASVAITVIKKDKDDADSDGDSDDTDSDDDNDGKHDDADSDDDGDGIDDDQDSDHDNDGIHNDYDRQDTDDDYSAQQSRVNKGAVNRTTVVADSATVAIAVGVRGTFADLLSIAVFDPNGIMVATSVPTPNGPMAIVPAPIAGMFSIEVTNLGSETVSYKLETSTQKFRAAQ